MPFNIGPFEVIVFAIVAGGILLLVTSKQRAGRPRSEAERLAGKSMDDLIAEGWRIESESADYVFLVKGARVNHLLHFIVGIFTLGLWWIVWIAIAAQGGERRHTFKRSAKEPGLSNVDS